MEQDPQIGQMTNEALCYVMRFDKSGEIVGELRNRLKAEGV